MYTYIDQFTDNSYERIETQIYSVSIGSFVCNCIVSIYRKSKDKVKFILYISQQLFYSINN